MGDFVVRLSSLTLQNIKNVKNGTTDRKDNKAHYLR